VIPFEQNPGRRHEWEDLGGRLGADPVGLHPERPVPAGRSRAEPEARAAWLIGPLLLASVAAGMLFVFRGPDHLFGIALGVVLGLGFLWILISVLFPGKPDRTCPRCGNRALERIDPQSTHGIRCRMCAWEDGEASGFLFAEEEGSFEDVILRERRRRW
jgi:hypothetical protein